MKSNNLMRILSITLIMVFTTNLFSQSITNKCGTEKSRHALFLRKPGMAAVALEKEKGLQQWINNHNGAEKTDSLPSVITIPVVVHVVYRTQAENISDSQIMSQIAVLNRDYQKLNADTLLPSHPYYQYLSNPGFEFCLAKTDPTGKPTTGITRTATTDTVFNPNAQGDDNMKFTSLGGQDGWDPTKYLNIWVCNLDTNYALGYTTYPDQLDSFPAYDGTVIGYHYFGTFGTVSAPYDLGRTTTHEIGHWMYLVHTWGDTICGNDSVADTPIQAAPNYGCPTFPHISCSNGPNGDMYMDYMDYSDDNCLNMFTKGQKTRMRATFGTYRASILASTVCNAPATGIASLDQSNINVYPNPSTGNLNIWLMGINGNTNIGLYNLLGQQLVNRNEILNGTTIAIQLDNIAKGVYLLRVTNNEQQWEQKVIVE